MKTRDIVSAAVGLYRLAEVSDTSTHDIIDQLVGVCFSEEEGSQIKDYIDEADDS